MSLCAELVGRIAKLKNWSGSVGKNGAYVLISSWDEQRSMFSAKLLETHDVVQAAMSQLDLHTADEFTSRYPRAPVVSGLSLGSSWPTNVVVDFSQCQGTVPSNALDVTISGSCRVVGLKTRTEDTETVCAGVVYNLKVITANEDDIVESEHLCFDQSSLGVAQKIVCSRGKIVFRNCTFSNASFGLIVGLGMTSKPNVTLEGCIFGGNRACAITVNSGRVTLVGCRFEAVGICVCIKQSAFLVADHCKFASCVSGIVCPNHGTALLLWCRFDRMEMFCVHVGSGSKVHIDQCVCVASMQGIVVSSIGKELSTAAIVGGRMLSCKVGLQVGNGVMKVRVNKTYFDKCDVGTCIGVDTRGTVALTDCSGYDCGTLLLDVSGRRCITSVDGSALTQPPQRTRVIDSCNNLTISYAMLCASPTAAMMRVLNGAGVGGNRCQSCQIVERALECFKKCADCKQARYCSRSCQKAHYWYEHKQVCKEVQMRAHFMRIQGYVACTHCHSIEVQRLQPEHVPQPFCADLGDKEKLFCNETCRAEHVNRRV